MANVYKTFTKQELDSKPVSTVSAEKNTAVNTTISQFITFFKAKHL